MFRDLNHGPFWCVSAGDLFSLHFVGAPVLSTKSAARVCRHPLRLDASAVPVQPVRRDQPVRSISSFKGTRLSRTRRQEYRALVKFPRKGKKKRIEVVVMRLSALILG
jgi:hypothetical protein